MLHLVVVVIIIDVHVLCCAFVTRDVSNNKSLFLIEKKTLNFDVSRSVYHTSVTLKVM